MKCDKIKELMMDFIDNELDASMQKQVQAHLETCAACKKYQESLLAVLSPFKKAEKAPAPEAVWQNIKSSIKEKERQVVIIPNFKDEVLGFLRQRRAVLVPVAIAAMLFLIVSVYTGFKINQTNLSNSLIEEIDSLNQLTDNGTDDLGIAGLFDNGLL